MDDINIFNHRAVFETENNDECLKRILEKGEVQLTAAERKEKVEKKKLKIGTIPHLDFSSSII
jgi:ribosome maturation protein Sdo1